MNAAIEADDLFGWSLAAADFDQDGYDDLAIGSLGENDEAGACRGSRDRPQAWCPAAAPPGPRRARPALAGAATGSATSLDRRRLRRQRQARPRRRRAAQGDRSAPVLVDAGRVYILFSLLGGLTDWRRRLRRRQPRHGSPGERRLRLLPRRRRLLRPRRRRRSRDRRTARQRRRALPIWAASSVSTSTPRPLPANPAANIIPWPPTDKQWIRQGVNGTADSGEAFDHFGWSLAAGDFDGDGFDDVGVGVPDEDIFLNDAEGTPQNCGMAHVFYGAAGGPSWQPRRHLLAPSRRWTSRSPATSFGQVGWPSPAATTPTAPAWWSACRARTTSRTRAAPTSRTPAPST